MGTKKIEKKIKELRKKLEETRNKPLSEFVSLLDDDSCLHAHDGYLGDYNKSIIHVKPWTSEQRKKYEVSGLEEKIEILDKILERDIVISKSEITKKKHEIEKKKGEIGFLEKDIFLIHQALSILK